MCSFVWDIGPWMSYTLRYHAYALIPLAFALSLLDLPSFQSNDNNNNNFFVLVFPLIVLLPALSSVWPEHAITLLGRPPWLPLSSIDVCLLGSVSYTVFAGLKFSVSKSQNFLALCFLKIFSFLPTAHHWSSEIDILKWLQVFNYIGVGLSSIVHPAMPALLGFLVLSISCTCAEISTSRPRSFRQPWLMTHFLALIPAGIWLFGWIASGRSHTYRVFTLERVFMLVQGAHSCSTAFTTTSPAARKKFLFSFIYGKVPLFLAVFVAFSGLWGSLHVVVPVMATLCSVELVLVALMVLRKQNLGKKKRR